MISDGDHWRPVQTCSIEDPGMISGGGPLKLKHIWFLSGRYSSYLNAFLIVDGFV